VAVDRVEGSPITATPPTCAKVKSLRAHYTLAFGDVEFFDPDNPLEAAKVEQLRQRVQPSLRGF
jgi:hypothetical protein